MILNNCELKSIGKELEQAESVLLFPHINPDPDAMGSCIALCSFLRGSGKKANIILEEPLPSYLDFLDDGYCLTSTEGEDYDLTVCIDCSQTKRFPGNKDMFLKGGKRLCIDHHRTDECGWDMYYIDPDAAATCEIIYDLFELMDWQIDKSCATALYTGISSDTGGFRYSNTTSNTHAIAGKLMKKDIDTNDVNVHLYQSVDRREIAVIVKALGNMDIFSDGRAAMTTLTEEELASCDARMEHTETVINWIRDIEGVEIAAFLKEDKRGIRASLRAKTNGNVEAIARTFGGGGHIKAAGCTLEGPMEEAAKKIRKAIESSLKEA